MKRQAPTRKQTDYLVVHCTATTSNQKVTAEQIDRWHRQRGWLGIGYHYVIRRDGLVEHGRHPDAIGAHVEEYNDRSVGIALAGGVGTDGEPKRNFNQKQLIALHELIEALLHAYPDALVTGHTNFSGEHKACPSFDAARWAERQHLPATGSPE